MSKTQFYKMISGMQVRYLSDVLYNLYNEHVELRGDINALIQQAIQNQGYDAYGAQLSEAELPMHPDHYKLKDFDASCLKPKDKETYDEIIKFSYLEARDHPNLIIYGPPGQGKEKLLIGLADHFCRHNHSVLYIDFHDLVIVLQTHGMLRDSNTTYETLLKQECLFIHDFAGQNIYDPDVLDALDVLLQDRINKQIAKHDGKWKPRLTYIDTCYPPTEWIKHFTADQMKVFSIINKLYGMGYTITVDESIKNTSNDKQIPNQSKDSDLNKDNLNNKQNQSEDDEKCLVVPVRYSEIM